MITAKDILLQIPGEKEMALKFYDGEILVLKNFDLVDETIYGRSDLFSATVTKVVMSPNKTNKTLGMIDFSFLDIKQIVDLQNDRVLLDSIRSPNQI